MLSLLLYHILVSLICTLTGLLLYDWIGVKEERPFVFYPLTGLAVVSLVAQLVALFLPVNVLVLASFSAILLLRCLARRSLVIRFFQHLFLWIKQCSPVSLLLMAGSWWLVLALNAGPTMMDDTESYHIQMVKWIHAYGTVPGLANLHARYGFNSSWFSAISFFLPFSSPLNFYTALNGLLSVWLGSYLLVLLPFFNRRKGHAAKQPAYGFLLALFFTLACWPLIRGNAATANYDFITTLVVFVLFAETVVKGDKEKGVRFREEWLLWPVYLFTIRITNYPLLLLSGYAAWWLVRERSWRTTLLLAGLGLGLVIPFLCRNFLLSGYPFYPAKQLAFFNVDWKVDEKIVDALLSFIKNFNRVNNAYLDISTTNQLTFPAWIPVWFRYLFGYDKLLLVPGLLGFGLSFYKFRSRFGKPTRYFILCLLLQLLSWFFLAPDPRFVYGCLLAGVFLLGTIVQGKTASLFNFIRPSLATVSLSLFLFGFALLKISRSPEYRNFVLPYTLPQPPVNRVSIDGLQFYIPEKMGTNWNARCYATDLPCLYQVNPLLRARGPLLRDGFRVEKKN